MELNYNYRHRRNNWCASIYERLVYGLEYAQNHLIHGRNRY